MATEFIADMKKEICADEHLGSTCHCSLSQSPSSPEAVLRLVCVCHQGAINVRRLTPEITVCVCVSRYRWK